MFHLLQLLLLSSLCASPSRAQDASYASMGTITRTSSHDASSRGPVVVQIPLQIDGREADLTLHSEDEPMDVLRAYVADNRLDPTAAGQVKERFLEVLRDLGAVPLVSVELVFTGAGVERSIPPKLIHYYKGQEVEQISRAIGKEEGLSNLEMALISVVIERLLDEAGVGEDRRPFPSGTVGLPDRTLTSLRRFRRIHIYPGNNLDAHFYKQNAEAMRAGLLELQAATGRSFPVEIVDRVWHPDHDTLYVLLSMLGPYRLPMHYVSVQLEQVVETAGGVSLPRHYFRKLRGAIEVWDYSHSNIDSLVARHSLPREAARHLPLFHAPSTELPVQPPRRYDVSHFGTPSERRDAALAQVEAGLKERGLTYRFCADCWGEENYAAWVALNVHRIEPSVLEAHRILPLVVNRVWVLTERSSDAWYDSRYEGLVDFVAAEDMAEAAAQVIHFQRTEPALVEAELEERRQRALERWGPAKVLGETGVFDFLASRIINPENPPLGFEETAFWTLSGE